MIFDTSEITMLGFFSRVMVLMVVIAIGLTWWDKKFGKERDPARAAIKRLKLGTIIVGIALLVLVTRLPGGIYETATPENVADIQRSLASDLQRMREIIYLGFLVSAFWFLGAYSAVKNLVPKAARDSE